MKETLNISSVLIPIFMIILPFNIITYAHNDKRYEMLATLLPKTAIIVEAGAHFGEDSVILSNLRPEGMVYCFEPAPSSFNKLKEKNRGLQQFKYFN